MSAGLHAGEPFIRGDTNGDGVLDLADSQSIFGYLFLGSPATLDCGDRADADDNGVLEITDGIALLRHLFLGSKELPPPGFACVHGPAQGIFCGVHGVLQPGYDPTTDDPFPCGDTAILGRSDGRPVPLHVPSSYDGDEPLPLVFFLHGGAALECDVVDTRNVDFGSWTEASRNFRALADEWGFFYAHPNAPTYRVGADCAIVWNATDACCAVPFESPASDHEYLRGLIDEAEERFRIDERRIYVMGRSNGGFMAHRMACEHSDRLAGIVSIAGATYLDPAACSAPEPVHVLQIHGTADPAISYEGGQLFGQWPPYPGAEETVAQWARHNGCDLEPEVLPRLDLEVHIDGPDGPAETVVERYRTGCLNGGSAELWTIPGGTHVPGLLDPWVSPFPRRRPNPAFSEAIIDWLFHHPKPRKP